MILLSNKFPAFKWSPSKDDNEWINNERVWILFQNNTERIAICSVYMACESPTNNDFKTWNDMIYAELSKELRVLENDGYNCVIIVGDFNAHVGIPPKGIDGNRAGVNYNGRNLLNFIDSNNLVMVNKDINLCTTTKKKGGLSIIKGPDGKIETEREKVADLAITELAKVFIGQKSPIFESHGQQIIKEIIVKNSTNYEKWIPKVNDEFKFESEVCGPSKEKIIAIIKSIKAGCALGVDGVLTTMLKNA